MMMMMTPTQCLVYLEDVIVFSSTFERWAVEINLSPIYIFFQNSSKNKNILKFERFQKFLSPTIFVIADGIITNCRDELVK